MFIRYLVVCVIVFLQQNHVADYPLQSERLLMVIQEFKQLCSQPAWQVWNRTLCGPLLFVDPTTRKVYASDKDEHNLLVPANGLYVGYLPENETIANTAKHWAGIDWIMVMLPLPQQQDQLLALLTHEAWHRIQTHLNLPAQEATNAHLANAEGRLLMLLELRALAEALSGHDQALTDAIRLRKARYQKIPEAASQEARLELNEGLAEYTAISLNRSRRLTEQLINSLKHADEQVSLERSFAYLSGPAYGLIIEQLASGHDWIKEIDSDFRFDHYLCQRLDCDSAEAELAVVFNRYQAEELIRSEQLKSEQHQNRLQLFKEQFATGPRLLLPLSQMQMSFDPNRVHALENMGTVYETITLIDDWGKLVSNKGLLINSSFTQASMAVGDSAQTIPLLTDDWQLTLNSDWTIIKQHNHWLIRRK